MVTKLQAEPGIDPRIKTFFGDYEPPGRAAAASRDELLPAAASEQGMALRSAWEVMAAVHDREWLAPSQGRTVARHEFRSQPDGNTVNIQVVRASSSEVLPCVYYIHGGGMRSLSCWDGNYRAWGRMLAHQGVAVALVDFRNSITPSSVPEVAPYPAGLNDCVSGVRWVVDHAGDLAVDAARIVVAGESGGGNLAIATGLRLLNDGASGLVHGIYALCPTLAGHWPQDRYPLIRRARWHFPRLRCQQRRRDGVRGG